MASRVQERSHVRHRGHTISVGERDSVRPSAPAERERINVGPHVPRVSVPAPILRRSLETYSPEALALKAPKHEMTADERSRLFLASGRIQEAEGLSRRGQGREALELLEAAFGELPDVAQVEDAFRAFLTAAVRGKDDGLRTLALTMLERCDKPWARELLAWYERTRAGRRDLQEGVPPELAGQPHAGGNAAQRRPIGTRSPASPEPQFTTRPPARSANTTSPRTATITRPGMVDVLASSRPLQRQPAPRQYQAPIPSPIRRDLTIRLMAGLRKGLGLMFVGFGIAALLGALVGAISAAGMGAYLHAGQGWGWQVWFALLSTVAGLLLGALGSGLGGAGVGLMSGTVAGALREHRHIFSARPVLIGVLGTLTGGAVAYAAFLLSGEGGLTVLALLLRLMPSQPHVIGLWLVWGAVGGLISSVTLLDKR